MKKPVCEICGGQNILKKDGIFECNDCGIKYTVEEVKKLLVEVGEDTQAPVSTSNAAPVQTTDPDKQTVVKKEVYEKEKLLGALNNWYRYCKIMEINDDCSKCEKYSKIPYRKIVRSIDPDHQKFYNTIVKKFIEKYIAQQKKDASSDIYVVWKTIKNILLKYPKYSVTNDKTSFGTFRNHNNKEVNDIMVKAGFYKKQLVSDQLRPRPSEYDFNTFDDFFKHILNYVILNMNSTLQSMSFDQFQRLIKAGFSFNSDSYINFRPIFPDTGYDYIGVGDQVYKTSNSIDIKIFKLIIVKAYLHFEASYAKFLQSVTKQYFDLSSTVTQASLLVSKLAGDLFIPKEYLNTSSLVALIKIVNDDRALTLKDALNFYDTKQYRESILEKLGNIENAMGQFSSILAASYVKLNEISSNIAITNQKISALQGSATQALRSLNAIEASNFLIYWNN